jgi:hypothetical protein
MAAVGRATGIAVRVVLPVIVMLVVLAARAARHTVMLVVRVAVARLSTAEGSLPPGRAATRV